MSTIKTALLSSALALLGLARPDHAPETRLTTRGWGIAARSDRPFYQVGDTVRAQFELFNGSDEDAFGFSLIRGGNGCDYSFVIQDLFGDVVWQPGSIVNGQFSGKGCSYGSLNVNLPSGTVYRRRTNIPLIYQNSGGFGTLGAPLPPGAYRLSGSVPFFGPNRVPGYTTAGGSHYVVQLPIKIEL